MLTIASGDDEGKKVTVHRIWLRFKVNQAESVGGQGGSEAVPGSGVRKQTKIRKTIKSVKQQVTRKPRIINVLLGSFGRLY